MSADTDKRTEGYRLMKGVHLTKKQIALALSGLLALLLVPEIQHLHPDIRVTTVYFGLCWGLAAVGLNLLLRHMELVSFGHAAYFGGGAYGAALATQYLGIEHGILIIVTGVLLATSLAILIGWLVAGYLNIYFALLTLAFNQLLFAIVMGSSEWLGSDDGLGVRPGGQRPTLLEFLPFEFQLRAYYLLIVVLLVVLVVTWRLINSPFGRALDAIGQNRTRAQFIGIPVDRYVWMTFIMSGIYGGLAGGMYAIMQGHVRPGNTLFVLRSGEILFMTILGGLGTLVGPILGGIVLTYLLTELRFTTEFWEFYTGLVLLFVVFVLPKGILGSAGEIANGAQRRIRNPGRLRGDASTLRAKASESIQNAIRTTKIILFGVK